MAAPTVLTSPLRRRSRRGSSVSYTIDTRATLLSWRPTGRRAARPIEISGNRRAASGWRARYSRYGFRTPRSDGSRAGGTGGHLSRHERLGPLPVDRLELFPRVAAQRAVHRDRLSRPEPPARQE